MANKKIAILSYQFMFNPTDTWQHVSQFEESFARFLRSEGLVAEVLDSIDARDARRILFIKPFREEPGVMGKQAPAKITNPQDIVKNQLINLGGKK